MKKVSTIITIALLFASCKTVVPNAPATTGKPFKYRVLQVSQKNGQTIAKVQGFRYWQVVSDTVKAGQFISVITVNK